MSNKIVEEAKEIFDICVEMERENREEGLADLRFGRLGEQWSFDEINTRKIQKRPCLTINKMPANIKQVINDARQSKTSIKVRPVDDNADIETAKIFNGIIRNIEYNSNADAAYDTALECAVSNGFGFWRVNVDYAYEDTFDQDIKIQRIANPFAVWGDPDSTESDSSDWNRAFVVDRMPEGVFLKAYKNAELSDWAEYEQLNDTWRSDKMVQIAEYWKRESIKKTILKLSDNTIVDKDEYLANKIGYDALEITVVGDRETKGYKVTQHIISGVDELDRTEWVGKYIPIVPVYGEEINVQGKRYLRSMINQAKDAQRMFNYWRTTSTELVALAPKNPWIGKKGTFTSDAAKWAKANTESYAYLEYDSERPTKEGFAGVPAGALQEAMNASDDIKAILNMHDASLGARSNETSGKAIALRQQEGDVGNFHFFDNRSRALRHTGCILIDLIPKIYTGERMIRILGESKNEAKSVKIGEANQLPGQSRVYDLAKGKYDVVVESGASYTTKRMESVAQITEMLRTYPQGAPLIVDILAENQDWPGADKIAERFKAMLPPQAQNTDTDDPAAQQLQAATQQFQQQLQQSMQAMQQLQQQYQDLQQDKLIEIKKLEIEAHRAETERLRALSSGMRPEDVQQLIFETIQAATESSDISEDVDALGEQFGMPDEQDQLEGGEFNETGETSAEPTQEPQTDEALLMQQPPTE